MVELRLNKYPDIETAETCTNELVSEIEAQYRASKIINIKTIIKGDDIIIAIVFARENTQDADMQAGNRVYHKYTRAEIQW